MRSNESSAPRPCRRWALLAAAPPWGRAVILVAVIGAIWGGARVSIPMEPVPVTLQTLVVVVAGATCGAWGAALATAGYLGLAAIGLPVLAGGASAGGAALLELKSFGYLVGFVAAGVVIALATGGIRRPGIARLSLAMIVGHALILSAGGAWLMRWLDAAGVWRHGIAPFLLGAALKSAVGAGIVWLLTRRSRPDSP